MIINTQTLTWILGGNPTGSEVTNQLLAELVIHKRLDFLRDALNYLTSSDLATLTWEEPNFDASKHKARQRDVQEKIDEIINILEEIKDRG